MKKISIAVFLVLLIFTNFFSNSWMLITDQSNYLPIESNIFIFKPTCIDEGSGGYWRYAQDAKNYYYFSDKEAKTYFQVTLRNNCEKFDKLDVRTWCDIKKISLK